MPISSPLGPKAPGEPGFTGIDRNGHHWQNGRQVAIGDDEPIGKPQISPERAAEKPQTQQDILIGAMQKEFDKIIGSKASGGDTSDMIPINQLRQVIAKKWGAKAASPEVFDEAVLEMWRRNKDKYRLEPATFGPGESGLKEEDLQGGIEGPGGRFVWLSKKPPQEESRPQEQQSPDAKAADYAAQLTAKFGDQAMERLEAMKEKYAGDEAKLNALNMVAAKMQPAEKPEEKPAESPGAELKALYDNAKDDPDVHGKVKDLIGRMDENLTGTQIRDAAKEFGINDLAGSRQNILDRIAAKVSGRREMFARTQKEEAKPIPSPLRKKEEKPARDLENADDNQLAEALLSAGKQIESRWGKKTYDPNDPDNKTHHVYIADLWRAVRGRVGENMSLNDFKKKLVELNSQHLINLSRADMTRKGHEAREKASEITYENARFHTINAAGRGKSLRSPLRVAK